MSLLVKVMCDFCAVQPAVSIESEGNGDIASALEREQWRVYCEAMNDRRTHVSNLHMCPECAEGRS